jgi:hypothetical protein
VKQIKRWALEPRFTAADLTLIVAVQLLAGWLR